MPAPEVQPEPTGPSPADDAATLNAAKEGDADAVRRLLAGEPERLHAVCLGMLKDPEAARDAAQDALVRVIRGLETFDGRARFSTWTTRIALNVCLTYLRDTKRHARLNARFPARTFARTAEPEGSSRVQDAERARRAADALATLSEEHRTVLVLRDIRGLDIDHVAEALGLPTGTVKSRLFRARLALRDALGEPESDHRPHRSPPDSAAP